MNSILEKNDSDIFNLIQKEYNRQQYQLELIASENYASQAVMEAQGSILTNKYAEGYPRKRYYGGCEHVDEIEKIAIDRAKKLFNCNFANVQPHSGSQANQAVMFALIKPNDKILGMSLNAGGHLTHGAAPNLSGKWFDVVQYGVREDNQLIDCDQVEALAKEHQPKLIIAGGSAYSRIIDFKRFREIADSIGAYLLVDMAHYSGLIAAGIYPSPFPYAHIVTSTTHKTLKGPRGGIILSDDELIAKKIDSAIFPGIQGGPLMHVIAAKAVAFGEALNENFKIYSKQVVSNAQALAKALIEHDIHIVSNGTDCHMVLVDLRSKNITGKDLEASLERAGLTCNKNSVPFDDKSPFITSGIRLGSPALTSRGFKEKEFQKIANFIAKIIYAMIDNNSNLEIIEKEINNEVRKLCDDFPIYKD